MKCSHAPVVVFFIRMFVLQSYIRTTYAYQLPPHIAHSTPNRTAHPAHKNLTSATERTVALRRDDPGLSVVRVSRIVRDVLVAQVARVEGCPAPVGGVARVDAAVLGAARAGP